MPREPRVYIEKALYLVTARVNNDRALFHDDQDYAEYLKPLSEYKLLNGFRLYAYALMPKQICLLIELRNNVTISTVMHDLNSRYTKNYNSRYGTKGHLFQGRFKSILIEKDPYLLRVTRYVHMLPGQCKATSDVKQYAYSSCLDYVSNVSEKYNILEKPDMKEDVLEVMQQLGKNKTIDELRGAYNGYMDAADKSEVKEIKNLLHRTSFVGSEHFIKDVKNKIEEYKKAEEEAKIVRKINPVFAFGGSVAIIFLSIVVYSTYNTQASLQKTLSITTDGFNIVRENLVQRVDGLEKEIGNYESKENYGLGGFAWELTLTPVQQERKNESFSDRLQFKKGKVISNKLMAKGFTPFEYTITKQSHGKMIWETVQTKKDGTTVRWYGVVAGDKMRGVLTEKDPAQGKSRDFSFVSVKRVNDLEGVQNVVQ